MNRLIPRRPRRKPRSYSSVSQFFHNFEHDPSGLNHCHSAGQYPYTIQHLNGKHVISARIACGHGKSCKPQWFKFTARLGSGWDLSSGVRIDSPFK